MEAIETLIRSAFPEHPIPQAFFASSEGLEHDIPQELASRVVGRSWADVSMLDWRLTGAHPSACRRYVVPQAFAYYVPSFLVGAMSEPDFLDWALEAVIPDNQLHTPRGEWWFSFADAFSDQQRAALKAFLTIQRGSASLDIVAEELVGIAEKIWS